MKMLFFTAVLLPDPRDVCSFLVFYCAKLIVGLGLGLGIFDWSVGIRLGIGVLGDWGIRDIGIKEWGIGGLGDRGIKETGKQEMRGLGDHTIMG